MKTTKKELLEMLKEFSDDTEIILQVRGNKSTDYTEERITVKDINFGRHIIIMDKLSE